MRPVYPSVLARARARVTTRSVNVAIHWLREAGHHMADKPKDPKEWREWARAKLEELANRPDAGDQ